MKTLKELLMVIGAFGLIPLGCYIAETLSAFDFINFNALGMILPIPVCIGFVILLIYTIKGE